MGGLFSEGCALVKLDLILGDPNIVGGTKVLSEMINPQYIAAIMTTEQLIIAFLSSSVIGGVIGAFITGRFNLKVKDREYENEYFKLVLVKRVAAYESIQRLVTGLKTAVLDDDRIPCHLLLSYEDGLLEAYTLLYEISSQALWLSDGIFQKTRDLGCLLYGAEKYEEGSVAFAKKHYQKLAMFREEIEVLHIRDMLSLHEVRQFLKKKNVKGEFSHVQLGG